VGFFRDVGGPVRQISAGREVDDHRMVLRAALGGIDGGYSGRILGIGA
jgi:hypothetical protein